MLVADRRLDLKNMMFARDARGLFANNEENLNLHTRRGASEEDCRDCEKVLSCGKNTRSFISPKPSLCMLAISEMSQTLISLLFHSRSYAFPLLSSPGSLLGKTRVFTELLRATRERCWGIILINKKQIMQ